MFVVFLVERAHHAHARDIFEQHGAHFIEQFLQFAEEGRGAAHDQQCYGRDDDEHPQQDQPHHPILHKGEDEGDDEYDGHGQHHLNARHEGELDIRDIGNGARRHGRNAEGAEIGHCQIERLFVERVAHIFGDARNEFRADVPAHDPARARNDGRDRHDDRGVDKNLHFDARFALSEHFRGERRDDERAYHVYDEQENREQEEFPMRFQKS